MEKLSIEEKAERYDKAIERANSLLSSNELGNAWIYKLLPELKESEDERIRGAILHFISHTPTVPKGLISKEDMIGWLEKQGEQKLADKVEPKFKVWDWVMLDRPVLITKVENMPYNIHQYWTSDGTWFGDATKAKLWTIQDAKDGDVLVHGGQLFLFKRMNTSNSFYAHCSYHFIDYDNLSVYECSYSIDNICPATKGQRDLLFQKIHDAGYEWDAEKKELKKIEQTQVIDYSDSIKDNWELIHEFVNKFGRIPKDEDELNALIEYVLKRQKFAWNEEDEEMHRKCICAMRASACGFPEEEKFVEQVDNWLKALKDRVQPHNTWKPSDEQMERLKGVINSLPYQEVLYSLYQDLKKLK